jgi:hypothetical protein
MSWQFEALHRLQRSQGCHVAVDVMLTVRVVVPRDVRWRSAMLHKFAHVSHLRNEETRPDQWNDHEIQCDSSEDFDGIYGGYTWIVP